MADARPCVAQYVGRYYLRPSQNWIYGQVAALRHTRSVFLAHHALPGSAETFPWPARYTLDALPAPVRLYEQAVAALTGVLPLHLRAGRREGVQIVHAHFGKHALRAMPLARKLGVPLVASFYGRDMFYHRAGEAGLRRAYRHLFAGGTAFVAEGPAAAAQLVRLGCAPEKVHLHRLGVDVDALPFVARHVAPGGPLRVLMAARFTEKKGLEYGMEAFCRLARSEPRLHLTVAGDTDPTTHEPEIRGRLHALAAGLEDRITFTGFLPSAALHALAREHHVLLHPSVRARDGDAEGGHPVVMTELAATGMPTIATRHCDIPEVVVDGQTGWLCPERDVDALVAALRDALAHPERIAAYGRGARALVARKYDVHRHTLDGLYASVLAGRGVSGGAAGGSSRPA
jgi:colanic acid/amylovoran biosynthesis glycosyltransferase